jgi:cysteine desulfurase
MHQEGQKARNMLNESRESISRLFHVLPRQVLFFSSATEALNTLIFSFNKQKKGKHLLSDIEHSAVFEAYRALKKSGADVDFLSVGKKGSLSQEDLSKKADLSLASVTTSLANNETGIITDIHELNEFTSGRSIPLLVDGVAALGKICIPSLQGTFAMCFGSHKAYAPKGVGLVILSKDTYVEPLLFGGKQESGRRAGTENVPAIWAFAKALEFLFQEQPESVARQTILRNHLESDLLSTLTGIEINGEGDRVCNVSNLFIQGVEGEELLMILDQEGASISVGSACSSGALEPSRVLTRMYSRERALSSIRLSLSKFTTSNEVEQLIALLKKTIVKLRK